MADLVLTVSAEEYNALLQSLDKSVQDLGDYVNKMDAKIGNLRSAFEGPQMSKAFEALDKNKENVNTAKGKLEKQVQIIGDFVSHMTHVDTESKKVYDHAYGLALDAFK